MTTPGRGRRLALGLTVSAVTLGLALLAGEAALRILHRARHGVPFFASLATLQLQAQAPTGNYKISLDPVVGWVATPGYRMTTDGVSVDGSRYPREVVFDARGFRQSGDPRTTRPKILVIGDSFTQAVEVSNDRTYFAVLGRLLDAEIFAYGAAGFATLQEYMILDRHIDRIRPDLVLWQFCDNDIVGNVAELQARSLQTRQSLVRPYLVDGRVEYALPVREAVWARRLAMGHSRLLYFVLTRVDRLVAGYYARFGAESVEDVMEREGMRHEGLRHAVAVTQTIMVRVRTRAAPAPVLAFYAGRRQGEAVYEGAFRQASTGAGVAFIDGVTRAVYEAADRGQVVYAEDGYHWNEAGHRVAAEFLAAHLRQYLPAR